MAYPRKYILFGKSINDGAVVAVFKENGEKNQVVIKKQNWEEGTYVRGFFCENIYVRV